MQTNYMKLILLALSTIFLSSCFPTQYYTVSAPNSYKNDSSELVLENDTVRVTYNLNGSGGPMRITIFNKTSQTMEVDWSKSSLVMDENVYAFHQPVAYVEGAGVTGNARGGRYSHFN